MRVLFLALALISFLSADVTELISKIKKLENYSSEFKKFDIYNIFETEKSVKTAPAPVLTKPALKYSLNAIFQNKANINGEWVKPGDMVGEYKVVKITDTQVILQKNNEIRVLSLHSNILKVDK